MINTRAAYKGHLTRFQLFISNIHDDFQFQNLDILSQKLKAYEARFEKYDSVQTQIEIEDISQISDREEVEALYYKAHADATRIIRALSSEQKEADVSASKVLGSKPILPKIEIPQFFW